MKANSKKPTVKQLQAQVKSLNEEVIGVRKSLQTLMAMVFGKELLEDGSIASTQDDELGLHYKLKVQVSAINDVLFAVMSRLMTDDMQNQTDFKKWLKEYYRDAGSMSNSYDLISLITDNKEVQIRLSELQNRLNEGAKDEKIVIEDEEYIFDNDTVKYVKDGNEYEPYDIIEMQLQAEIKARESAKSVDTEQL